MSDNQKIESLRELLIQIRWILVELMMKDPTSSIHIIDFTPGILRDLEDAASYCSWLTTHEEIYLQRIEFNAPYGFHRRSTRLDFSIEKIEEIIKEAHDEFICLSKNHRIDISDKNKFQKLVAVIAVTIAELK